MGNVKSKLNLPVTKEEILNDYQLAVESREASLMGRKEVFMGKAKFGIFGDGKEIPQIAMAKYFRNGDWRSGYYRDQTFMMSIGQLTTQQFFAQLYAHTDVEAEPASAGRMMNGHFGTRYLNEKGEWLTQTDKKNSSSDISPTAGQMPRLLGLAYASKLYRNNKGLKDLEDFSINGNEIAFGTIGNASTSEGPFWEAMNAAGVLQVPMIMSVWDDEYGISVPQKYHTIKESISEALAGFQKTSDKPGFEIFTVKGWDYIGLLETYKKAISITRKTHTPCLIHVTEITQPQGHSTSGSHERYKSKERLQWEKEHDCILKMRKWIESQKIATSSEIDEIEKTAKSEAKKSKEMAWKHFIDDIKKDQQEALDLMGRLANSSTQKSKIEAISHELRKALNPEKADVMKASRITLRIAKDDNTQEWKNLQNWIIDQRKKFDKQYSSHLYSQSADSALNVETVEATYSDESRLVDGREVLNACFEQILEKDPRVFAMGEDVGKIGDVNQGFAGLQEKHGELRVTDTGIREASIIGQGVGSAIRGLRPIAEIQYLDYLLYAIQTLSDDLATLHYRTFGGQKAPLIIRTRGHRLEGIWHTGSPMGMILNSLRGIMILTPRNMTQAAGFYNTLIQSDDPALMIESLNGYRLKERIPENLSEFKLALGIPEILKEGTDITLVTYGSTCRVVLEAANQLSAEGIDAEVIDVQTLIPFDREKVIVDSLKKTNRLAVIDEDVEGGASAYIMQQVLERDGGYYQLDSKPKTITGREHRAAYGSDGDYFSKPNVEDIVEDILEMMSEVHPDRFKNLY
jgi:pyruvate/2-oxoglutarate/acetoin dehydrogenase E1 component/TPP-dependent pyruvate/acetoin dehydrogenase alpha subunit